MSLVRSFGAVSAIALLLVVTACAPAATPESYGGSSQARGG